jgi:hypothetical protein
MSRFDGVCSHGCQFKWMPAKIYYADDTILLEVSKTYTIEKEEWVSWHTKVFIKGFQGVSIHCVLRLLIQLSNEIKYGIQHWKCCF